MDMMLTQEELLQIGKCGAAINRVYTRAFNAINVIEGHEQTHKPEQIKPLHTINEVLWALEHKLEQGPFLNADTMSQLDDIRNVVFDQLESIANYIKNSQSSAGSTSDLARNSSLKQDLLNEIDKANSVLKATYSMIDGKQAPAAKALDHIPTAYVTEVETI